MNTGTVLRLDRFFPTETASFGCVRCNISGESESQNNRMFILGAGYVGQFFAADLKSKGWAVSGTCTSIVNKKKLEEMGFDAYVFDANDPQTEVLDIMKCHTHLLVSVPPILGVGDPMLQHKDMLKSRLDDGNLQWLSYLSSTRVYGDSGGAWVDEDHPLTPSNELARTRLAAEEGWLSLGCDLKVAVQVFRLGGIYGPGRSAIDTIIKQEPLSRKQKVRSLKRYTNRVHVADICQALDASIQKPSSRKIFNLVDDNPASRKEVFTIAWNMVRNKWPSLVEKEKPLYDEVAEAEENMEEKRVCNARMKEELGVELLYPTYQAGLKHIIDNIDTPFVDN